MTAEPSQHDTSRPAPAGQAGAETSGPAGDAAPDVAQLQEGQIRELVAALQDENEKLRAALEAERDHHLRVRADTDNIRRRTERELAETAKYAIGKFAGDIVGVADNFDRAIKSVPDGAIADNPTLKALLEGVTMTEREFLVALERHGVRRVSPRDQPFNPHLHQAVMEVDNPSVPTGTCVQVFQPGYTIEDRVLRPAMVSVSRGGPKLQKAAESAGDEPPPTNAAPGGPAANGTSEQPTDENGQGPG